MTSNDLIIIEAINGLEGKIISLQQDIKNTRNELLTEIKEVKYEGQINNAKIEILQHSIYWGFAIIAFVVAFVTLYPFNKDKKEKKSELSERDIRSIIREEISMASSVAKKV